MNVGKLVIRKLTSVKEGGEKKPSRNRNTQGLGTSKVHQKAKI